MVFNAALLSGFLGSGLFGCGVVLAVVVILLALVFAAALFVVTVALISGALSIGLTILAADLTDVAELNLAAGLASSLSLFVGAGFFTGVLFTLVSGTRLVVLTSFLFVVFGAVTVGSATAVVNVVLSIMGVRFVLSGVTDAALLAAVISLAETVFVSDTLEMSVVTLFATDTTDETSLLTILLVGSIVLVVFAVSWAIGSGGLSAAVD